MALLARGVGRVIFLSNIYFSKLILNYSKVIFSKKYSPNILLLNKCFHNSNIFQTVLSNADNVSTQFVTYEKFLAKRRSQARRSIVIEIQSERSCKDLYNYCSQFGEITGIFHYTIIGCERHFVIIEFQNETDVNTVKSISSHTNQDQTIPVQSTMLWFRNSFQQTNKQINIDFSNISFSKNSCKALNNTELFKMLIAAESISDQIKLLYEKTKLNDVEERLRFCTAYQIECNFSGLFPNIAVLPFGSSVNGFGKQGCDLDLCLVFEKDKKERPTSRFVFQTKSFLTQGKHEIKRIMEVLADTMHIFTPGISNVRKILEARVPIIKFYHSLTGLECDLGMTNTSAHYMSELLYIYGEIDWRVKPLIFTIRKWAEILKLTTNTPGPWITNFSLSVMVLFFLQHKKILPPLHVLKLQATKDDIRMADIYIDCTFQRDLTKIHDLNKITNTQSLEELLLNFFAYYSQFDFGTKAICIREGKPIAKPDYAVLYIRNPLEASLNVSKNVKFEQLDRIVNALRSASWLLEISDYDKKDAWGLVNLFSQKINKFENRGTTSIDFSALFETSNLSPNKKTINYKKKERRIKTNT